MPRLLPLLVLALSLAAPAFAQRELGDVNVSADNRMVPVRVSGATPELNALAWQAFSSNGRYHVVQSNFIYDL